VGSSGKKRTTMAKLNREVRLRDKRVEKQARKAARKLSAERDAVEAGSGPDEPGTAAVEPEGARHGAGEPESATAAPDEAGRGR
jgi:hypothetical protein